MSFSRNIFEENGTISKHLYGYEIRPQQIQMAEAVEEAIDGRRNLIVEAGTGVGKSLAYLVPFINWAVREDKRCVISTYTKALQNQLFIKDLPFLSRALDVEFRYALCMGSANYVCLRKAHRESTLDLFETKKRKKQFEKIIGWLAESKTGLVTDMDFVPDRAVWDKFSREGDLCLGRKCQWYNQCFYMRARQKHSQAHVLITNHSLLFTDMMSEGKVLPDFQALVLDEAHTLEDVATRHFGKELTSSGLRHLLESVSDLVSGKMIEPASLVDAREEINKVGKCVEELQLVSDNFFKEVENISGREDTVTQFDKDQFFVGDMSKLLEALALALVDLRGALKDPQSRELAKAYAQRCDKFSSSLDFIFTRKREGYAYWLEVRTWKSGTNYSFRAAPINVSEDMRTYLFEKIRPVVLTSATLSSSGATADFTFIKSRLGLDDPLELALDSPFDYANNVLMYLPRGITDPKKDFDGFRRQVGEDIIRMYDIMGGRIFALFTSYEMLNRTAANIAAEREDINILKQGDLPRYVLLDVFKKNPDSILMGTTTFWQGVDVPGSSLECVIITKLPFSVPSDPLNVARMEALRERGLNPFNEYQLPQAVIMFKQGFGRLIRGHSDRGVVAVLDPRIRTRYYGRQFINALPECRKTDDIHEVETFFQATP
ncbi:MAG: helicase C-terminal domain-containing protein [Candidatus Omnitrophota bacterium]